MTRNDQKVDRRPYKVDRYVDDLAKKFKIPGMTLGIYENGALTYWCCRGKVSLTFDVETSIDSVFQLASVTKQFTGAAVALLAQSDDYDFQLDHKLIDHLPKKYQLQAPKAWSEITIRHLLNHTSGLPNRFEATDGSDDPKDDYHTWRMAYTTDQLFDGAKDETPKHRPGARFLYSDTGYFLLGLVIEAVSKQPFRKFVRKKFFEPLGMRDTRMVDRRYVTKRMANAYRWNAEEQKNRRDRLREVREEVKSHYGAISTILDLARWEAELHDPQILSRKSVKAMFTPHRKEKGHDDSRWGYGFGWFWWKLGGQVILDHSGITGTYYMRIPDKKISLVLLTNQSKLADHSGLLPNMSLRIMEKYRPDSLCSAWQNHRSDLVEELSKEWKKGA